MRFVKVAVAGVAFAAVFFATPSHAGACLAYSAVTNVTSADYDTPDVAAIGRATIGGPPGNADFTLTDVVFARGKLPRPVRYASEDGWQCHAPNFNRGDRILTLRWGDPVTYLGDFSGATWRIDEAGTVLPGLYWTTRIDGKVPATVTEILSHFDIATPDAATAPPPKPGPTLPTLIGLTLVAVAAALGRRPFSRGGRSASYR
jgi:hypothetical protein